MIPVVIGGALVVGGIAWAVRAMRNQIPKGTEAMFDCSEILLEYHDDEVVLTAGPERKLRERRDANRTRLKRGFRERELAVPQTFVSQGSYAMSTLVRRADDDHDIDDGVVVPDAALLGPRGGEMSGVDARNLVRDCVNSHQFTTPPEVKAKCVRVFYNEGHHVDIPVYRERPSAGGGTHLELAASDWELTNPRGVTKWFEDAVTAKSPDDDNGRQMRRIVRYLKKWTSSRTSWNLPSGFILSVLVNEVYVAVADRDDVALYECMRLIKARLDASLVVAHPVLTGTTITKTAEDPKMISLREKLNEALDTLKVLTDHDCSKKAAFKAWDGLFSGGYFSDRLREKATSWTTTGVTPSQPVEKDGGRRYG